MSSQEMDRHRYIAERDHSLKNQLIIDFENLKPDVLLL